MFEALFACPGTFSPTVCFPSHIVALGLFASECESTGSAYATLRTPNFSRCLAASPLQSYFPLLLILQVWLNVSFELLVVGLPYTSIFGLLWFLVLVKFVLVLVLVVWGEEVHLPRPVSWPEVTGVSFKQDWNFFREEIFIITSVQSSIFGWILIVLKEHVLVETSGPFLGGTILYFILQISNSGF